MEFDVAGKHSIRGFLDLEYTKRIDVTCIRGTIKAGKLNILSFKITDAKILTKKSKAPDFNFRWFTGRF